MGDHFQNHKSVEFRDKIMATETHGGSAKAVIRELGESKGAKQKIAKDARKQIEMKGKQIKDAMSLAMIYNCSRRLDKDPVEANIFDDADVDLNRLDCGFAKS